MPADASVRHASPRRTAAASSASRGHGTANRHRVAHYAAAHHGRSSGYRRISYHSAADDPAPLSGNEGDSLASAGEGFDTGMATWYGGRTHTGRRTASGDILTGKELTAAHLTLPFNTRLRITNISNGRSVVVRINDRGPFSHVFKLDLSEAAADAIDIRRSGRAMVRMEVVQDMPQYAVVPAGAVQSVSGVYACAQGRPQPVAGKPGERSCR